jgi:magnesium transporter
LRVHLARETAIGVLIGTAVGNVAGLGLLLWSEDVRLALVIAVTLVVTALVATVVATVLPWALARLGADPAIASGPVATVTQDILSVAIYLSIATALL